MSQLPPEDNLEGIAEGLIEDYVLDRLPAERRDAVLRQVEKDPLLRGRVEKIRHETNRLQSFLLGDQGVREGPSLSDEVLALYLDQTLSATERDQVEQHLSRDRQAQERLIRLYREVRELLQPSNKSPLSQESQTPLEKTGPSLLADREPQPPTRVTFSRQAIAGLLAGGGALAWIAAAFVSDSWRLPLCFLGLAWLSSGLAELVASKRKEVQLGGVSRYIPNAALAGAVILFVTGTIWPLGAPWLLCGSTACFWYWLWDRVSRNWVVRPRLETVAPLTKVAPEQRNGEKVRGI